MVYDTMELARETLDNIEVWQSIMYKPFLILKLSLQDYNLSQTTLNDVFVHFANEQSEDAGLKVFPSTATLPVSSNKELELPDSTASLPVSSNRELELPDIVTDTQKITETIV